MSIILITHDLGVVAQTCKRVAVMCGGYVVEEGTVEEIFLHPGHPYTQALIASMPRWEVPLNSFWREIFRTETVICVPS